MSDCSVTSVIKFWLYIVCMGTVLGFINALAIAFAPLVSVATISLTVAYFYVITRVDGPLEEWVSRPVAEE